MRALIVVESLSGNTQAVGEAIAAGLAPTLQAEVVHVAAGLAVPRGIEALIVGGPTHAHGMSRASTRKSPQAHAPQSAIPTGVREWLAGLTPQPVIAGFAFDTRVHKPRWLTGSAAVQIGRRLGTLGLGRPLPPESFFVHGTPAVLDEGELARARAWGVEIAATLAEQRTRAA